MVKSRLTFRHPRPGRAALAGLMAGLCAAGAACSSTDPAPQTPLTPQLHARGDGPPLPDGAQVERPGERPPLSLAPGEIRGTLPPDSRPAKTRIPSIVERGRLIVGVDQSQYLLSFRDAKTGELSGFEVALAHEFARDIFDDPEAVEFRFIQTSQRREALDSGLVDMVISASSITEERQRFMAFSAPYLTAHTRLLVLEDSGIETLGDLGGQTLCVADGSTGLQFARAHADFTTLLKVRNWSDCLVALQQNQTDAILSDDVTLSGMAAQASFTEIVGPELTEEYYGVAMALPDDELRAARRSAASEAAVNKDAPLSADAADKAGTPEAAPRHGAGEPGPDNAPEEDEARGLVRQVNQTLARIKRDGTWQSLYDAWFSPYLPAQSPPPVKYADEAQLVAQRQGPAGSQRAAQPSPGKENSRG